MSNKWKAFLSIFVFALCLFMMIETKYRPALGDLVFESLGFKAWSNGSDGLHLTVLFFGVLSFISFHLVRQYAHLTFKMKSLSIFLSVIVLVTSFSLITNTTTQYIKSQSDGLNAVALISHDNAKTINSYPQKNNKNLNTLQYDTRAFEVTDFEMGLTLKNYGKKEVSFFIEFEPLMFKDEPVENMQILNKNGSKAEFTLKPGTTQRFVITDEMYQITGGMRGEHSSYNLSINEVILTNSQGEMILLSDSASIAELLIHK